MKIFEHKQLREAYAHADAGGQALHLWTPPSAVRERAPLCFRQAKQWAHLIDYDLPRLKKTARRLGIRRIAVDRIGQRGQHVDLCGKPLAEAIAWARGDERGDIDP